MDAEQATACSRPASPALGAGGSPCCSRFPGPAASQPRGRQQAGLVLAATFPWMLFIVAHLGARLAGHPLPGGPAARDADPALLSGRPCSPPSSATDLFDLELAVRRSLIYTLLTSALMLVFYAALGAGGGWSSRTWSRGGIGAGSSPARRSLLGLLFAPLRRALQRLIDRRFFPERYALRQRLVALAGELPALGKLPRMGEHLVERLTAIFRARSATLLIAHPETGLPERPRLDAGRRRKPAPLALDDPGVEQLRRAGRAARRGAARRPQPRFPRHGPPDGLAVPLLSQERLIGVLLIGGARRGAAPIRPRSWSC